ncbi:transposase [Psychromonas sp.]|nr:transposase [Psychromonas sp.]
MHKSLVHFDQQNAIQFVTFRTQASIAYYLDNYIIQTDQSTSKQQQHVDKILDNTAEGAILNGELINLLINFFKSKDNLDYKLIAVSIMPNHIHILFQQLIPLPSIMHHIKGASANLINKHNAQTGALWDKSYFDKAIKDDKQFQITYQYIKNNAYKANLADADKRFYGIYENECNNNVEV